MLPKEILKSRRMLSRLVNFGILGRSMVLLRKQFINLVNLVGVLSRNGCLKMLSLTNRVVRVQYT